MINKKSFSHLFIFVAFFLIVGSCDAATLTMSDPGGHKVGETFSVLVHVSTAGGEAMNAVSCALSFPADKLQVVSLDKTGVMDFWAQPPSYSNADGSVSFEGVTYNPGFTGPDGKVIAVTFKAIAAGTAPVSFSSAEVLANDGKGTSILTDAKGVNLVLTEQAPAPSVVSALPDTGGPSVTQISSPTHPDSTRWYNQTAVTVNWVNPSGVTSVRIGIDKDPSGVPTVVYGPSVSSKSFTLKEGVWYFHVQEKNTRGWGSVSHFRIQIDTTPPDPMNLIFPHGTMTTDPRPVALFNTKDSLSGVAYYEVSVNGNGAGHLSTDDVSSNPYALPIQNPGTSTVQVIAYDAAGNSIATQGAVFIEGLKTPIVDPIADLTAGDILEISGSTVPDARVDVFVKDETGNVTSQSMNTASDGTFRLVWKHHLDAGVYSVNVQATDNKGAKSTPSSEITFQVKESAIFKMSWLIINYLSLGLLAITVLTTLILAGWYLYERIRVFKHLTNWFGHAQSACKQCTVVKGMAREEILSLEAIKTHRTLIPEEEKLMDHLNQIIERGDVTKSAPTCPPEA